MTTLALATVAASAAVVGVRPAFAQVPIPQRPPEAKEVAPPAEAKPEDPLAQRQALAETRKRLDILQARHEELLAQLKIAQDKLQVLTTQLKERALDDAKVPPNGADPNALRPGAGGAPAPRPDGIAAPAATSIGGVQLDLVNLANSVVDASGAYKQAKITSEQRETLKRSGAFNDVEVAEARARLETAEKRLTLLRAIAQSALQSAKSNYARVKREYEAGMTGYDGVEELSGKLKMLELIVKGAE
jgi:hypothetical protein